MAYVYHLGGWDRLTRSEGMALRSGVGPVVLLQPRNWTMIQKFSQKILDKSVDINQPHDEDTHAQQHKKTHQIRGLENDP